MASNEQPHQKLALMSVDPDTLEAEELARFTLDSDGEVQASWKDPYARLDMLTDGIQVLNETYRPTDGAKFMLALEKAYTNSSFMYVQKLD